MLDIDNMIDMLREAIEEKEWDFQPVKLYEPSPLDYNKRINNSWDICYNMKTAAKKYTDFLGSTYENSCNNSNKNK